MKELEEKLKELKIENICVSDLEILDEINYQSDYLEIELTEEEKERAFSEIHRAWLKTDDLPIYQLTTTVLENIKDIGKLSTWDIIEKTCWRCF